MLRVLMEGKGSEATDKRLTLKTTSILFDGALNTLEVYIHCVIFWLASTTTTTTTTNETSDVEGPDDSSDVSPGTSTTSPERTIYLRESRHCTGRPRRRTR